MKIREGFVSNSSSSSFILNIKGLNPSILNAIRNHIEMGKKKDFSNDDFKDYKESDKWTLEPYEEDEDFIVGYTSMTNFDLPSFCTNCLGIDEDRLVVMEEDYSTIYSCEEAVNIINKNMKERSKLEERIKELEKEKDMSDCFIAMLKETLESYGEDLSSTPPMFYPEVIKKIIQKSNLSS